MINFIKTVRWIFLLIIPGVVFSQDVRIAHVDSKIIFENYMETKTAQSDYDKQVAIWEQKANLMQKELASLKEKMEKQSLMLSDEARKTLESEYAQKERELKDFVNSVYGPEGEVVKENEKITAPIIEKIRKTVNEVALQEGYDMVIDRASGSVLYWKNENDLTQKVLDYLNTKKR